MTLDGRNAPLSYYFTLYIAFDGAWYIKLYEDRPILSSSAAEISFMSLDFSDVKVVQITEVLAHGVTKRVRSQQFLHTAMQ